MSNAIETIKRFFSGLWRWIISTCQKTAIAGLLVALGYFWGANTILEGKPSGVAQISSLVGAVTVPSASAANTELPVPPPTPAEMTISKAAAPATKAHNLKDPKGGK